MAFSPEGARAGRRIGAIVERAKTRPSSSLSQSSGRGPRAFERGEGACRLSSRTRVTPHPRITPRLSAPLRKLRDHSFRAIPTASRIAALMLPASATPCPAMSNAVPWSGLVRMIGKPTVMFTARSHAIVFSGISP